MTKAGIGGEDEDLLAFNHKRPCLMACNGMSIRQSDYNSERAEGNS
jgi:hypothetical protein